jgi:hypothetical protein
LPKIHTGAFTQNTASFKNWFLKSADFFAENWTKSPKIVITTSTPDMRLSLFINKGFGPRISLLQRAMNF